MQGSLCDGCSITLDPTVALSTACDICDRARMCLRCAITDDSGLAICKHCKALQQRLQGESDAKRAKLQHCDGCMYGFSHKVEPCRFCKKYYCASCVDEDNMHRCVQCAIVGCDHPSDRRFYLHEGEIVSPGIQCCGTGPLCGDHRRAHYLGGSCLTENNVQCQRCQRRLKKWLVCLAPTCNSIHACADCRGYCGRHLDGNHRCGMCFQRHFRPPLEQTGLVWGFGLCCETCFMRLRTFIEYLMLRRVPKDVVRIILNKVKFG